MTQPRKTRAEVAAIISAIEYPGHEFLLLDCGAGWLLQLRYYEADVEHPSLDWQEQKTRKWYISPFSTETEIVETAYAACLRSAKHRVREHFKYDGMRVMSPHIHIRSRVNLCTRNEYDKREPLSPEDQ